MPTNGKRYNVGGVMLERPFKIRRLGHFGFNLEKIEEGRAFYGDLLGFKVSDLADFSRDPCFTKDFSGPQCYFIRFGSDHHALVLFSKQFMDQRADRKFQPGVTINQITWQCGSLQEIGDAHSYFQEHQVRIQRVGRDMPGSNWHTYVYDPDGHTNELYYGIEQIGWNQLSKPKSLYYLRGFQEKPPLPQMSEAAELKEAAAKGIDVLAGHKPNGNLAEIYDVEGVLLARPFKITKIGPVSLFVDDVEAAERFYIERLGFLRSPRRPCTAGRAASFCAAAPEAPHPRPVPQGIARDARAVRAQLLHVVRRRARQLRAAARGRCVSQIARCRDHRRDPARTTPASTIQPSRSTRTGIVSSFITTWSRSAGTAGCGRPPSGARSRHRGPRRWSRSPTPTRTRCSRGRSVNAIDYPLSFRGGSLETSPEPMNTDRAHLSGGLCSWVPAFAGMTI